MEARIFSPKKTISVDIGVTDIVGKKVLGKNGEILGKVSDIIVENHAIQGIIVKEGMQKYFVDFSYIDDMYADSVILNINPLVRLLGMKVFDIEGRKLGKVIDIVRNSNTNVLAKIMVKKNVFSRVIEVPGEEIDVSGKNIILNKEY